MIKKILGGLLIVFVAIQFIRPAKNESNENTFHISTKYAIPSHVNELLQSACNDCHSNKTNYPWYANIQPGAWFLSNHVTEGKEHLNFSEFTNLRVAVQFHKLEETIEMIEEKEMPLASYTYLGLHKDANLTDADRAEIIEWANGIKAQMQEAYPADSLIMKNRKKT